MLASRIESTLEWLALMQHHGTPIRLLDWTRSPHIAAFCAAQSSNAANPFITAKPEKQVEPFVIWAVDVDSVNAEAVAMRGLAGVATFQRKIRFSGLGPLRYRRGSE